MTFRPYPWLQIMCQQSGASEVQPNLPRNLWAAVLVNARPD